MSPQRFFSHILVNTLLAGFASSCIWFALTFWVYLETRSVMMTSLIGGSYLIMVLTGGMFFGSFVDHYEKKRVMQSATSLSIIFFILALAVYVMIDIESLTSLKSPALLIFVFLILSGTVVGNIRMIALSTLITLLFQPDMRDRANGQVGIANGIIFAIVSVFSGIIVGQLGILWALSLSIGMCLVSLVHISFLTFPQEPIYMQEDTLTKKTKQYGIDLRGTLRVIGNVPGLWGIIIFSTMNNFIGGVFMALIDAYGLSLVSVETWGILLAGSSMGFIIGGYITARLGLGKNPVRTLLLMNMIAWTICIFFTSIPYIVITAIGMLIWMIIGPIAEACEQTILQKVVPFERQGRVFGLAQSIEQTASPITAFLIGPFAELFLIPWMGSAFGIAFFGGWFGTSADRALALIFSLAGIIGIFLTLYAFSSRAYRDLSKSYAPDISEDAL